MDGGVGRDQGLTHERATTSDAASAGGFRRRSRRVLYQRPRLRLGSCWRGPLVWLLVAYIGVARRVAASRRCTTTKTIHWPRAASSMTSPSTTNYHRLIDPPRVPHGRVPHRSAPRSGSPLIDLVIALPVAFYMAKMARPVVRRFMVSRVTCRCGPATSSRGTRGARSRSRRRCAARGVRALAGIRLAGHDRSRCRTCGCPT